jgi:protein-L-isoaspartate O-methyltransferase
VASAATLRRRLVRKLEGKGLLRDRRVREAFLNVPREQFVPTYAEEKGLEAVYLVAAGDHGRDARRA